MEGSEQDKGAERQRDDDPPKPKVGDVIVASAQGKEAPPATVNQESKNEPASARPGRIRRIEGWIGAQLITVLPFVDYRNPIDGARHTTINCFIYLPDVAKAAGGWIPKPARGKAPKAGRSSCDGQYFD